MPGLALQLLLDGVKRKEVEDFERKSLIEEKEREGRLKSDGQRNINMLLEDAGLAQTSTSMNLDTLAPAVLPPAEETKADPNSPDGKAAMDKFLEQFNK